MKNNYKVLGDVTVIYLKRRSGDVLETYIDTEDLEIVDSFPNTWIAHLDKRGYFYVVGSHQINKQKKNYKMHRLIMGSPECLVVDHKNHNTLDNRKQNLRAITDDENKQNIKNVRSKTSYRGVTPRGNKFEARSRYKNKYKYLGLYETAEEAYRVVRDFRKEHMPYSTN
jgi:hypothetical protein